MRLLVALLAVGWSCAVALAQEGYVKKATRVETIRAALVARGLPDLGGKWLHAGPFDFSGDGAFDAPLPPDADIDLAATYRGKGGVAIRWAAFDAFELGKVVDLQKLYPTERTSAATYLLHDFESKTAFPLPLSLGSDDTLTVIFNGVRLLHDNVNRAAVPDSDRVELKVKVGKNRLVIKVGQYNFDWAVYVAPEVPGVFDETLRRRIDRDFPPAATRPPSGAVGGDEAKSYAVETFATPENCVLEVGGLDFRPDGKLLACTRRGEVWLIDNPTKPAAAKFTRFAAGLHEALGLHVLDDRTVLVAQRPELTRLTDSDGDGVADRFTTVCDRWGVSGDYHEYAFGPAVDRAGDAFLTLNVGFGGGHQAKAAWRGWCVKVSPDGAMEPWAYGLRSPNGVTFSPDGDLFYADNQGEWCATNKLCQLKRGAFYGHQAGLKWVKDSPFAGTVKDTVASGMHYDGTDPRKPGAAKVYPAVEPPAVWFPYGRMGQSLSEPKWDTTAGKFGPFAGQCFVGDQSRSVVMRVALEKVNGVSQGACFPFRGGFQCGVNRLAFGPDGSLYVGQTNRGWGSTGGKPYGLQRLRFTGEVPAEIHAVKVTPAGFALSFTKPLDHATITKPDSVTLKSWTYAYLSNYGAPEADQQAEPLSASKLSADGLTLTVAAPGRAKGRVFEFRLDGVKTASGEPILHPEAYYTLNELPK